MEPDARMRVSASMPKYLAAYAGRDRKLRVQEFTALSDVKAIKTARKFGRDVELLKKGRKVRVKS